MNIFSMENVHSHGDVNVLKQGENVIKASNGPFLNIAHLRLDDQRGNSYLYSQSVQTIGEQTGKNESNVLTRGSKQNRNTFSVENTFWILLIWVGIFHKVISLSSSYGINTKRHLATGQRKVTNRTSIIFERNKWRTFCILLI